MARTLKTNGKAYINDLGWWFSVQINFDDQRAEYVWPDDGSKWYEHEYNDTVLRIYPDGTNARYEDADSLEAYLVEQWEMQMDLCRPDEPDR